MADRELVERERRAAWEAVKALIVEGELPGNGWDKTAERNGIILAANLLAERLSDVVASSPSGACDADAYGGVLVDD